jgi:hypothetical protein
MYDYTQGHSMNNKYLAILKNEYNYGSAELTMHSYDYLKMTAGGTYFYNIFGAKIVMGARKSEPLPYVIYIG